MQPGKSIGRKMKATMTEHVQLEYDSLNCVNGDVLRPK